MANPANAPGALLPQDGRYSYELPPVIGSYVLSPGGRSYKVINVTKDRRVVCEPAHRPEMPSVIFQANDLRVHWGAKD